MTPHALLFTLSAIGISETVYLIRSRIAQKTPICILGEECRQVLESNYQKTLGVSNDILGLVFYSAVSLLSAFLVIEIEPVVLWDKIIGVLIFGAALTSLYFIYLQWRVIKAWCFWCLMSAFTIFFMAFIILVSDLI